MAQLEHMQDLAKEHGELELRLVGIDGNAFVIMGAVTDQARRQDWPQEAITALRNEMLAGDYDHLLQTAMSVCEGYGFLGEDADEEDEEEVDPRDEADWYDGSEE